MSEETHRVGLGKIIYSVNDEADRDSGRGDASEVERATVEEADKESFPASDPPGFVGRSTNDVA